MQVTVTLGGLWITTGLQRCTADALFFRGSNSASYCYIPSDKGESSSHIHHLLQRLKRGVWRIVPKERLSSLVLQRRFYVGSQGTFPPDSLVAPQIQKQADHSDVISEVSKCTKIQIFLDSAPNPAGRAYIALQTP